MNQQLRRLDVSDYDAIISLWSDAGLPFKPRGRDSQAMMAVEMSLPQCAFFGLFEDDKLLAVGIAEFDGRRGWINRLAVHPDHRGEGLAGRVIHECEYFLEMQGAVVIAALIEEVNFPSMACFHKEGFVCLEEYKLFTKRKSPDA